jgi:hypothetical protein
MRIVVALIGFLAIVIDARAASVHKCRGEGSAPVYQDKPCEPSRSLRDFDTDPPPLSVVPFERSRDARTPPPRSPRAAKEPSTWSRQAKGRTGDPAERRHLKEGMSEGEVFAKLGAPDMKSGKRWTYLPAAGDPQTVTIVRFEDGKVLAVERRVQH